MPINVIIKLALVKTSEYSSIKDPIEFMGVMNDCIRIGKASDLFKVPNILLSFYDAGTVLTGKIQEKVNIYIDAPIEYNLEQVEIAHANGLVWMNSYASQVQVISNLPANRTTQAQAAANIEGANLKYQALEHVRKGTPVTPQLGGKVGTGSGNVDVEILNAEPFNPSRTILVSVSEPAVTDPITPPAIVTAVGNQINIQTFGPSFISVNVIPGKGRISKFKSLVTGIFHGFWALCSNAKNKNSEISAKMSLKL